MKKYPLEVSQPVIEIPFYTDTSLILKRKNPYCYNVKGNTPSSKEASSKGAAIFSKILEDKKTIVHHIKKGGKIVDLKDKFSFVKTVSIKRP